jgi:hypothetical protein
MKLLFAGLGMTALALGLLAFTDLQPAILLIGGPVCLFLGVIQLLTPPDRGPGVSAGSDFDARNLSDVANGGL